MDKIAKINRGKSMNAHVRSLINKSKDKPVVQVRIKKIKHILRRNPWPRGLGPKSVMKNPNKSIFHKAHHHRIVNAELKYPVILSKGGKGKLNMRDGYHRLTKAAMINHSKTISAKIL